MSDGIHIQISKDQFNSEIFGITMGNVSILSDAGEKNGLNETDQLSQKIADSLQAAKQNGFDHLTCKVSTEWKQAANALEQNGFCVADVQVTYVFDFAKSKLTEVEHCCVLGDCREEDVARLKELAKSAYKADRFHSDPTLPNDLCDQYYEKWFENSYHGFADKVLVAYWNGQPVGFTTGKYTPGEEHVQLVLSAVDSSIRGRGIYTSMIYGSVHWGRELADRYPCIKKIFLGTQIDTIAVQKAWIKLGFTMYSSQYVFQRRLS